MGCLFYFTSYLPVTQERLLAVMDFPEQHRRGGCRQLSLLPLKTRTGRAEDERMKTTLITAGLFLLSCAAFAQDAPQTTLGYQPIPGDDRPSTETAGRDHQHVSYFNDSLDHFSVDMQMAADAYSADELVLKNDKVSLRNYEKRRKQDKERNAQRHQ